MLEELSDHILDVAMNSIRAGAKKIDVSLVEDPARNLLTLAVLDDGTGMSEDELRSAEDPFFSTKGQHSVGLGVPLLKGSADQCSGEFTIESAPGVGTGIRVSFRLDHPDRPPVGHLKDTILLLCVTNPDVRFVFRYITDGKDFTFDTDEINRRLNGVVISYPAVVDFLIRYLDEYL